MIYILDGDTFTGKTSFLRKHIKDNPQKNSLYLTDEAWIDLLIRCAHKSDTNEKCADFATEEISCYDIVCIDNADFLAGRGIILGISANVILNLYEKTDFFLSGINMKKKMKPMIDIIQSGGASITWLDYRKESCEV